MRTGPEATYSHVVADPAVMLGKPVIAGTRITVESILERFAAGESTEQVLDAHPRLTEDAIRAALAFAAAVLRADVVYPISSMNPAADGNALSSPRNQTPGSADAAG